MNLTQLTDNGIPPNEAAPITAAWNVVYVGIREQLTEYVKMADELGGDSSQLRELRRELGQLDRCAHRACTQSPPGFSAYAALYLIEKSFQYLPPELRGDTHRLAALLADQVLRINQSRSAKESCG